MISSQSQRFLNSRSRLDDLVWFIKRQKEFTQLLLHETLDVLEISLGTITHVLRLFRLRQGSQDMRRDDLLALIPTRHGQSSHAFSSELGVGISGSEGSTGSVPDLVCIGLAVGDSTKEMRRSNIVTACHGWT